MQETDTPKHDSDEKPDKHEHKHPVLRFLFGSLFGLLVLIGLGIGVLQFILAKYADPILGTLLKEIVEIKSQGRYQLSYDQIEINLIGQKLKVLNLNLHTTAKGGRKKVDFALNVPDIYISGLDIWDAYFKKEITFDKIDIQKPNLDLFLHLQKGDTVQRKKKRGLYFLIESYAKLVNITAFKINNAFCLIHVEDSTGGQKKIPIYNINLEIEDFRIDEATHNEFEPFKTSQIKLSLSDNSFSLKNDSQTFLLGELLLDTKSKQLELNELYLVPKNPLTEKDKLSFYTPTVRFSGVEFKELYEEKHFHAKKLYIEKPDFEFRKQPGKSKASKGLKKLALDSYLRSFAIDTTVIDSLHLKLELPNLPRLLDQKDLVISLFNTGLDSAKIASLSSLEDPFIFKDFEARIPALKFNFPDKRHSTSIQEVVFSTMEKKVLIKQAATRPTIKRGYFKTVEIIKPITLIEYQTPEIAIEGVDIWKLIKSKQLEAASISSTLYSPKIDFFPITKESQKSKSKTVAFDLPKDLKSVQIGAINLNLKEVEFLKHLADTFDVAKTDELTIGFKGISIQKGVVPGDFPFSLFKDLEVNTKRFTTNLVGKDHQLFWKEFKYEKGKKHLEVNDLSFLTKEVPDSLLVKPDKLSFELPNLTIKGFDLSEIANDSIISFEEVLLKEPDFLFRKRFSGNVVIEERDKSVFPFKKMLTGKITLQNASIHYLDTLSEQYKIWNLEGLHFCSNAFRFDSALLAKSEFKVDWEELDGYYHSLFLVAPDSSHFITTAMTGYDDNSKNFFADSVRVEINTNYKFYRDNSHAEALFPSVQILGWDLKRTYHQKELIAKKVKLFQQQGLGLIRQDTAVKTGSHGEKKLQLPLERIQVDTLQIASARQKLNIFKEYPTTFLEYDSLQVELQNLNFIKNQTYTSIYDLLSEKSSVKFFNVSFNFSKSENKIKAETLWFSHHLDSIRLNNLSVSPKKQRLIVQPLVRDYSAIDLHVQELILSKAGIKNILQNKPFNIGNIQIKKPKISIQSSKGSAAKKQNYEEIKPGFFVQKIKESIGSVAIQSFYIQDAEVSSINHSFLPKPLIERVSLALDTTYHTISMPDNNKRIPVYAEVPPPGWQYNFQWKPAFTRKRKSDFTIPEIDFEVVKLNVDSTATSSVFESSDDIKIFIHDFYRVLPDSLNAIKFKQLGISTRTSRVYLDSLQLVPLHPKYKYGKVKGKQTDHIQLLIPQTEIINLDFPSLIFEESIIAERINVKDPTLKAFRDKTVPRDPEHKPPPMPWQMVQQYSEKIDIDSLMCTNFNVRYEEYTGEFQAEKKRKKQAMATVQNKGVITFDNMNVYAINITNVSEELTKNNKLQIFAETDLMKTGGKITTTFSIPQNDPFGNYTYTGRAVNLNLPSLNPMLEKIAFIKIEEGTSEGVDFKVHANDRYAVGNMKFRYEDLKISVLNKNKIQDSTYKVDKFVSFLANNLIRSKNPGWLTLREGEIYFERDTTKYWFNYIAKTIMSGIKSTLKKSKRNEPPKWLKKKVKNEQKEMEEQLTPEKRKKGQPPALPDDLPEFPFVEPKEEDDPK